MPHKVESDIRAKSFSRRTRVPLLLHKLLKRTVRKVRESAIRRLKLYDALRKPLGRRKALIVACAYGNPMSRASTRDDRPTLPAGVILEGPSTPCMIMDLDVESQEPLPMEIILQLDGDPIPRGKTDGALKHSHRDGYNLRELLQTKYKISEIEYLSDDGKHELPTAENIKAAIRRLVDGAQSGDSLVFGFIGHGGQRTNLDGTEIDNKDEIIVAVDEDAELAAIVDDELHDLLVKPLPHGCKLTAIIDACHSGTALDLKYANDYPNSAYPYRPPQSRSAAIPDAGAESDAELSPTETRMVLPSLKKARNRPGSLGGGKFMFRSHPDGEFSSDVRSKVAKAKVFCLSACRDDQETYEWKRGYTLTHFLVETVRRHKKDFIKQRRLLAKITREFDRIHKFRPEYPKPVPQLGSNIKRPKWKHEFFISH